MFDVVQQSEPLKLGVLLGDDIGLEVVPEAVKVVQAAADQVGLPISWSDHPIGRKAFDSIGKTLPDGTLEALEELDGWILGPIGHRAYPKTPGAINPHPIIRRHFDMYSNVQLVRSFESLPCLHQDVDLVIVRENTEGFQPDRNVVAGSGEFRPSPDMTISVRVITRQASSRIARAAFELASTRPRKKVTAVHKETIFKLGCGMFAEECRKVAEEFPDVELEEVMVDTFALRLVMNPQQYDVVLTTNMFGDIINDEAAGLVGGLGMTPRVNTGTRQVMAQAPHGSAPDIAGRNIANPYSMIMSAQMMLDWLGRIRRDERIIEAAGAVKDAAYHVIEHRLCLTPDLGGQSSTTDMGDAIVSAMKELSSERTTAQAV
jgi:3-isopropylmalate dehydrogenase